MRVDPGVQRAEPILRRLQRQRGGKLRLASGPLEEHDEPSRYVERHIAAEILLDQSQGEINAGGDAG